MQVSTFAGTGRANYEPNSLAEAGEPSGPRENPALGFTSFPAPPEGANLRIRPESFADHYSQARMFFRSLEAPEQDHVASALVFELSKVALPHVRTRMMANLRNVDETLAARVASGLGMELPAASRPAAPVLDLDPTPALRIVGRMKDTLQGRKVGILFADGSDGRMLDGVIKAVADAGGKPLAIAPKVGGAVLAGGAKRDADAQLAGSPSVLFDAVALVLSADVATALAGEAAAVQFVMDAFGHLKAIGHSPGAKALLDKAGVVADEGVVALGDKGFVKAAGKRFFDREPKVRSAP